MQQDVNVLIDLARTDRTWFGNMYARFRRFIARLNAKSASRQGLYKLERMFAKAAKASNKAAQTQKSPTTTSGVQRSMPSGAQYMMQTSDARFQQEYETKVDEVLNGQYKGVVLVGRTPQSLIDIGFNQLPLTITSEHIYTIAKTQAQAMNDPYYIKGANYHGLGDQAVKEIRKQLENPIMILQHQEFTQQQKDKGLSSKRVVVVVQLNVGGNQVICPIEVDGNTQKDGRVIDANVITTYFDKGSFGQLLQEAIAKENIGETGFFYLDKKRSEPVLKAEGHQLPPRLLKESSDHDIIIRDISEKINRKISHFTQSQQFIRWFGDWQNNPNRASKIVNDDGTPKIMYHGTSVANGDFTVFDETKAVKKGGLGFKALGKGNYFTAVPLTGNERYGERIIPAYLCIKNPFVVEKGVPFKESVKHQLGYEASVMRYDDLQTYMRQKRYDGVIQVNKDGEVELAVTFDSTQIKSATDNIGTFDATNPDIRYSLPMQPQAENAPNTNAEQAAKRTADTRAPIDVVSEPMTEEGYAEEAARASMMGVDFTTVPPM